jgi:hypothetical protein
MMVVSSFEAADPSVVDALLTVPTSPLPSVMPVEPPFVDAPALELGS